MIEAAFSALTSLTAGGALDARGGAAAPSSSGPADGGSNVFDTSGWTVAVGGSKASGAPDPTPWWVWAMLAGVAVVGLVAWKR